MSLTFSKVTTLPEDLVKSKEISVDRDGEIPMPTRRLRDPILHTSMYCDLPSSLNVTIGDCLGSGRSSYVFEIEPFGLPSGVRIPPLVAKFGLPGFNKSILREAWYYEEMQTLQGEVIPWFFGLYYARIPRDGVVFLPWFRGEFKPLWKDDKSELEEYLNDDDRLAQFFTKYTPVKNASDITRENNVLDYIGNFKEEYAELVKQFDDISFNSESRDVVVPVLILERLGKPYLPLGGKNWPMLEPIPQDMMFVTFCFLTE